MTTYTDGPAKGHTMFLQRAPLLLRVVVTPAGEWDALDELDDTPARDETITVYHLVGEPTRIHIHASCKGGGRRCGWYQGGEYRLVAEQPSDDVLRDRVSWQAWATSEAGRYEPNAPGGRPRRRSDA